MSYLLVVDKGADLVNDDVDQRNQRDVLNPCPLEQLGCSRLVWNGLPRHTAVYFDFKGVSLPRHPVRVRVIQPYRLCQFEQGS